MRGIVAVIEITFSDILKQPDIDVIVNPAAREMHHFGGLARVMMNAAGEKVEKESKAKAPIMTGDAIITGAGNLPNKAIIHAVGPKYGLEDNPGDLLAFAYMNSILLANQEGYKSIAFPAISCGVYMYPVKEAAPIAVETCIGVQNSLGGGLDLIKFCLLDDEHFDAFNEALLNIQKEELEYRKTHEKSNDS